MGYYTKFNVSIKGKMENKLKVAELEKAKADAKKLTGKLKELALAAIEKELTLEKSINIRNVVKDKIGYNPFEDQTKWYEHEVVMKEISKEYPDVIIQLTGEGEENSDMWIKYFVNGKMQHCEAKIVFEEFDPKKLK